MQLALKEIAELQAGYAFRSGIEPSEKGMPVVQIKDVSATEDIRFGNLTKTVIADFRPEHLVRASDVLVTTRGVSRRATAVKMGAPEAIFTAQILALRLRDGFSGKVIPAYLAWYLNRSPAQQYLEENAGGSYIQSITKESLGNLSVVIPAAGTQRQIVELYNLSRTERRLTEEIQIRRERLIETALLKMVMGKIREK